MIFLLYAATAAALLGLAHRFVQPISRAAALLLFVLPFCWTGYAIVTDGVFAPIDFPYATEPLLPLRAQYGVGRDYNGMLSDVASQMIPWRKAVQWSLAHGQWPIHNPFILSGDILAAAAQPAAYSPFTLIACLLPVAKSLTYSAAIAFFIAALSAFLFARELGCAEVAALIASAGWMTSIAIFFFILWPLGVSWTFFPLVLLGVRRVVRAPSIRSIALLATAFTLMLLSGHPETALHIVFLGGAYAVFELVIVRRNIVRAGLAGLAGGVIALLICAVYILPILEAAPQTEEQLFRQNVLSVSQRGVSTDQVMARVATDIFPFLHVRQWKKPGLENLPIDSAAVGSVVLMLAIYAIWRVRSAETWFFFAVAIFGIVARSEWAPLAQALQRLPLFNITLNERFSFAAAFSLALLAALGANELLRRGRDTGAAITAALVLIVITVGTIMIVRAGLVAENVERWGDYKIFAEIAGLAIVTGLLVARLPARWLLAATLGIIVLQRVASEQGLHRTFPARAAYPPIAAFEPMKKIREPFRVVGIGLNFIPGTSALYELEDVRGYEAMTFRRYADTYRLWCERVPVWFNRVHDLTKPFLSFLNVRYAIVWPSYPVPDGWREVTTAQGTKLLENTRVIERAFVPRSVKVGMVEWQALNDMAQETDFREHAWIRASGAPYERVNGPGRVTVVERPLVYDITAQMEKDGWIVVSETAWSGWRAYVDGHRVRMQIANYAFLSVYVRAGQHRVKLVYKPESFVSGRIVSIATLVLIAAFIVVRRVMR